MTDILQSTRNRIATDGGSELTAIEDQPAAREVWEKIQSIRNEKYAAVKEAVEKASAPYDAEIRKLEEEYAFLIRMTA